MVLGEREERRSSAGRERSLCLLDGPGWLVGWMVSSAFPSQLGMTVLLAWLAEQSRAELVGRQGGWLLAPGL